MKAYMIECSTGCTCCCNENHYRGFYRTEEEANRRIAYFLSPKSKFWPLASQYAARGKYTAHEADIEEISNDRYILDDNELLHEFNFLDINEDGSLEDNEKEYLDVGL